MSNIHVTGAEEGEREERNKQVIFGETMADNFQN